MISQAVFPYLCQDVSPPPLSLEELSVLHSMGSQSIGLDLATKEQHL